MKPSINFKETSKLPQHIQFAIYHNPENVQLQAAFPACFIDDGLGTQQIPWSYINKKGYIGTYCWSIDDQGTSIDEVTPAPVINFSCDLKYCENATRIFVPSTDPLFNNTEHMQKDGLFKPFIYEIDGTMYLIIALLDVFADAIPLSIIDFSK